MKKLTENEKKIPGKIFSQMFDVRPVKKGGSLDLKKIKMVKRVARIEKKDFSRASLEKKPEGKKVFAVMDVREEDAVILEARRFQKFLEKERFLSRENERKKIRQLNVSNFDGDNLRNVRVEYKNNTFSSKKTVDDDADILKEDFLKASGGKFSFGLFSKEEDFSSRQNYSPEKVFRESVFWKKNDLFGESNEKKNEPVSKDLNSPLPFSKKKAKATGAIKAKSFAGKNKKDQPSKFWKEFKFFLKESLFYRPGIFSKNLASFGFSCVGIFFLIFGAGFFSRGIALKDFSLNSAREAYADLSSAGEGVKEKDFLRASADFSSAYEKFDKISKDIKGWGGFFVDVSKYFPYASKLSSGANLAEAGKNISRIGILSGEMVDLLEEIKNPLEGEGDFSYLKIYQESFSRMEEIISLLKETENLLEKVNIEDIPAEQREKFVVIKTQLPEVNRATSSFLEESRIFNDILGGNGPRKYLFLFQNNHEIRATGGFIGSYAVLDIFDGRVKNFFVDGIFNPDGQLREKIVPPVPVQKISAAWSLHDSNWFPDFPKSAEKAVWFYEKTGGPTVDGVITMTPLVMQRLLEITGPVEMSEYGLTINKDNFVEVVQTQVEVDFDKDINQPKKILADLAPIVMDRIFNAKDMKNMAKTMNVFLESLNEKHILIYSRNYQIQEIIGRLGWDGRIMESPKDYLSVVNTNINGFKTDGVIEENIEHQTEVQEDGSIIDKVKISRRHLGGNTEYDWWNRVNANYMRVYVPKGSKLISASGHTRETNVPPLDYNALGFKKDPQVKMEEESSIVDEESGTLIFEDSGKTVFGNWVYVSPQETVEVEYVYLLPFKIETSFPQKPVDSYSILFQKQSGSPGSHLSSRIYLPDFYETAWTYPEKNILKKSEDGRKFLETQTDLKKDLFFGAVVSEIPVDGK